MDPASHASSNQEGSDAWTEYFGGLVTSAALGSVAGAVAGFLWGGVGGRIAMRVLFLTSDERVRGLTSDDGFEIGQITFSTIFLLVAMTFVGGVLGACYGFLRMLLAGPLTFVTLGMTIAVGAFGGAAVVNTEGIDFRVLEPLWLAVGLFVALPAAWGATVPALTDRLFEAKILFPERPQGVDAKPFRITGSVTSWLALIILTAMSVADLVGDVRTLG